MYKTGIIKWSKIDNIYWQKIYIAESGSVNITYHYKNKKPPPCIVIEIYTKISQQLSGYHLIEKDLRDTLLIHKEYLKITTPKIYDKDKIIIKALIRAIVITYGKCFVKADGRNIKLDKKFIPKEYETVHEYLMRMRHQYIAHAGQGFENSRNVLILPPERKYTRGKIVQTGFFSEISQVATHSDIDAKTKDLIQVLHRNVKEKIQSLTDIVGSSINDINPNKLYILSKKRGAHFVLNENDLSRLFN